MAEKHSDQPLQRLNLLALSGSLRAGSTNKTLLAAAAALCPGNCGITLYSGIDRLPHFNADHDQEGLVPPVVGEWRDEIARADGLLISCPEYAGGLPGSFKNALDWLVGDARFQAKPIALFSASPRAVNAQNALQLVLRTMGAEIVEPACITLALLGSSRDWQAVGRDESLAVPLRQALEAFAKFIRAR